MEKKYMQESPHIHLHYIPDVMSILLMRTIYREGLRWNSDHVYEMLDREIKYVQNRDGILGILYYSMHNIMDLN